MNQPDWYQYLFQLHAYIKQQDKKINALSDQVNQLMKQKNPSSNTTIEKLEYHFDQLKIERMDGTLHIGLAPEDIASMDDFSVPLQPPIHTPSNQPWWHELEQRISDTLPTILDQLANDSHRSIDQTKRNILIQDIRNQLSERISFYEKQAEQQQIQQLEQRETYIFNKIQEEIKSALHDFFSS